MNGSINMFVKKIVWAVLAAVMVVAFCGCDLWMNDWKGYLDYWSEAVLMGRVEVSGATFQTNDAGVQTLPLDATAKISGYVINPQGHTLLDSSVEINDPTLANSATKNVADPTLISVLLENVASQGITEHTTFAVTFAPVRADTNIASTETMSVTLQYNTPPAAPVRINQKIADDGSSSYVVVNEGELWTVAQDGYLYWAWDDSETDKTSPKHAEYFVVAGSRKSLSECKVDPVIKVGNRSLFRLQTSNTRITLAAVDEEGVSSPVITSGSVVPAGAEIPYEVTFDNGDGTTSNTTVVYYGKVPSPVTPPKKTGHAFGGYFTEPDGFGTQYYDEDGRGVKSWVESNDTTLYAKWIANTYTVEFNSNGGNFTGDTIQRVTYPNLVTIPVCPTKTNMHFEGWYTADGQRFDFTQLPTKDETLTAQYVVAPQIGWVAYEDGSLEPADYYNGGKKAVGIIFDINTDNTIKIVALNNSSSKLSWYKTPIDASKDHGAWYETDGRDNMAAIQTNDQWQTEHPAFYYCYDYSIQTDASDKNKWYLPATKEAEKIGGSKDIINASLSKIPGTTVLKESVWTSRQKSNYDANYWNIQDNKIYSATRRVEMYVRPIRVF